jgi:hypothetical protein
MWETLDLKQLGFLVIDPHVLEGRYENQGMKLLLPNCHPYLSTKGVPV